MEVTKTSPSIAYEVTGSGPDVILVRGLGRTRRHWPEALIAALAAEYRVITFDNTGVGESEAPRRVSWSTRDMAGDVARVLDEVGSTKANVFGMSLGGMVAQWVAIDFPYRVDRLVLGCTTAGRRKATPPKLRDVLPLLPAKLRGQSDAVAAEAMLQLNETFRRESPEVLKQWQELARRYPTSTRTFAQQLFAVLRHDSWSKLGAISAPTLILTSDADRLVPPENSRALARQISGAELSWIPGAGHDFATDASSTTIARLLEFYGRDARRDGKPSNSASGATA